MHGFEGLPRPVWKAERWLDQAVTGISFRPFSSLRTWAGFAGLFFGSSSFGVTSVGLRVGPASRGRAGHDVSAGSVPGS